MRVIGADRITPPPGAVEAAPVAAVPQRQVLCNRQCCRISLPRLQGRARSEPPASPGGAGLHCKFIRGDDGRRLYQCRAKTGVADRSGDNGRPPGLLSRSQRCGPAQDAPTDMAATAESQSRTSRRIRHRRSFRTRSRCHVPNQAIQEEVAETAHAAGRPPRPRGTGRTVREMLDVERREKRPRR